MPFETVECEKGEQEVGPPISPISYKNVEYAKKRDQARKEAHEKYEENNKTIPKFINKLINEQKKQKTESTHPLAQIQAKSGPQKPVNINSEQFIRETNIEQKKLKNSAFTQMNLKNSAFTQMNNDETDDETDDGTDDNETDDGTDDNETDDETDDKIVENEILQLEDKKIEKINNQFEILTEIESIIAKELEKGEINSEYLIDLEDLFLIIKQTSLDFIVEKAIPQPAPLPQPQRQQSVQHSPSRFQSPSLPSQQHQQPGERSLLQTPPQHQPPSQLPHESPLGSPLQPSQPEKEKKNLEEVKKKVDEILENDEIKETESGKRLKLNADKLNLNLF